MIGLPSLPDGPKETLKHHVYYAGQKEENWQGGKKCSKLVIHIEQNRSEFLWKKITFKSTWTNDLNMKGKTLKHLKGNMGEYLYAQQIRLRISKTTHKNC